MLYLPSSLLRCNKPTSHSLEYDFPCGMFCGSQWCGCSGMVSGGETVDVLQLLNHAPKKGRLFDGLLYSFTRIEAGNALTATARRIFPYLDPKEDLSDFRFQPSILEVSCCQNVHQHVLCSCEPSATPKLIMGVRWLLLIDIGKNIGSCYPNFLFKSWNLDRMLPSANPKIARFWIPTTPSPDFSP